MLAEVETEIAKLQRVADALRGSGPKQSGNRGKDPDRIELPGCTRFDKGQEDKPRFWALSKIVRTLSVTRRSSERTVDYVTGSRPKEAAPA
jgi:hypothetical protein